MAAKGMAEKILELAAKFVTKQKGDWDHAGWEDFVTNAEKAGLTLGDEARRNLGNLLEAAKYFYHIDPPKKTSKPRAKAKPKSKEK